MTETDTDTDEIRVAYEATDWFLRLDDGELDETERRNYVRWLKESPAHVRAMLLLSQLCDSLHAAWDGSNRNQRRRH